MEIPYAELYNCGKCLLLQTIYFTHITDDDRVHICGMREMLLFLIAAVW